MERTDFEQWKAREVARLLALVETERRYYQEMVASLPVALVVLSADRSILSVNRAFRHSFGLRSEDLRRKSIEQIIPSPQLVERIRDVHVNGMAQPDLYLEVDGRPLRIALVPIRNWDDEGELETLLMVEDLRVIGSMLPTMGLAPVAEPILVKTSAPAVADSEIPAVLWGANADNFTFTSVAGAAAQLFGYPVSHWLGTADFFSERIHPEDRQAAMAFFQAASARPGDASVEFRAVTASGGVIWCRETIRVPELPARTITGVTTNISLRKQLEEQLLTAERRGALHTLSSRLAHDLNNPLMIITGYSEDMLQTLDPQDAMRGDVEQILGATERVAGITSQLLAFTRRFANPPQQVELGALFAAIKESIAKTAGEGATVEFSAASESVWASADPAQLEEVLLALISSGSESRRVTIGWELDAIAEQLPEATLRPGMYARIVIHDAHGADPSRRATIFESVLAGRDPEQMSGPALARAYAIVREWDGDIAFSVDPLRGSTFMLYLPYAPPAMETPVDEPEPVESAIEAIEETVELPPQPVPEPTRGTILLVEDEAGIRALVRKILTRERYHVLVAATGEEALSIAQSHEGAIDLLMTDVILPGIGGRDVAEALRAARPEMHVLYVSGYTDDESVREGSIPPGSKFLQKPFTLSSLTSTIQEAL
jgi:PAS domain S-box-containing protein